MNSRRLMLPPRFKVDYPTVSNRIAGRGTLVSGREGVGSFDTHASLLSRDGLDLDQTATRHAWLT
jgi:hypothetical protein